MRSLALLLRVRIQGAVGALRAAPPLHRAIGAALGAGSVLLFVFLLVAFRFLLVGLDPASRDSLIARTFDFLFFFLLAGAVPFVSATLFAPGDLPLLAASPVRPAAVVVARLIDAAAVSSAQFLVIGVPLLLAPGMVLGLGVGPWLAFTLAVLLFLVVPPWLVAAVLLLLARLTGLRRVRAAVAALSVLLSVGICLLMVSEVSRYGGRLSTAGLRESLRARGLSTAAAMDGPPSRRGWLPSAWAADALHALASPRPAAAVPSLLALLGAAALAGGAGVALGRGLLMGETLLEGEGATARSSRRSPIDAALALFFRRSVDRALLEKDLRYVLRDLVLLSQIGIPVILYLVPFVIAGQMRGQGAGPLDMWVLSVGMVATIAYIETSILGLSSIGLEGRGFWLVLAAPVTAGQFVRAKYRLAFLSSTLISVSLYAVSCAAFRAPAVWAGAGLVVLVVVCAALSGLGVGISGIFPRFVYENPAHRASLSALIWGFVTATAYVIVSGVLLVGGALLAQYWPERGVWFVAGAAALWLALSFFTGAFPLGLAVERLKAYPWEE